MIHWLQALQQNVPYQGSGQQTYGHQAYGQQQQGYGQQPGYGAGQITVH